MLCRGVERGTARPEVLQSLLKTTERVVQEVDSVEYGLTDIQVVPMLDSAYSCVLDRIVVQHACYLELALQHALLCRDFLD